MDPDLPLVDDELEAMKARVKEMEEEAAKLREMQAQVEKEMNLVDGKHLLYYSEFMSRLDESKEEVDSRSVYVGNVSLMLAMIITILFSDCL
jgi:polyadenylate-binding protein 2